MPQSLSLSVGCVINISYSCNQYVVPHAEIKIYNSSCYIDKCSLFNTVGTLKRQCNTAVTRSYFKC